MLQRNGFGGKSIHDSLERIIGADLLPGDVRESVVGQRFGHAALEQIAAVFILAARKSSTIARAFRSAASQHSWAWMASSSLSNARRHRG